MKKLSYLLELLVMWISVDFCRTLSRQDILNKLLSVKATELNGTRYDSSIAPDFELETPTLVKIQIIIQNIYSVSEASMDFSVDVLLRQMWKDQRLKYGNMSESPRLELDNKLMEKVWAPDTYFANEKTAHVHDVTVSNKMMHLYRNGTVNYSMRDMNDALRDVAIHNAQYRSIPLLSLKLACAMRLEKYPLDHQKCPVIVESYGYTIDNIIFEWADLEPFKIKSDIEMPQFEPGSEVVMGRCNLGDDESGKFACLLAYVHLKRKVGYFVVQVIIPSILIVVLSWVSFWVDHEAVPARISLGVLTVLTMTTQSSGALQSLPQVSYIKANDVWMSTCLLFVFAALIEYSYINVLARRHIKMVRDDTFGLTPDTDAKLDKEVQKVDHRAARRIDKISRIVFPVAFVVFNVVYWTTYTLMPNSE